jgi:hypothetical protein
MSFEMFDNSEKPIKVDEECKRMFELLDGTNYAVSTLKGGKIREQAKLQGYKVTVTAHPRDTTYIVKLKRTRGDT